MRRNAVFALVALLLVTFNAGPGPAAAEEATPRAGLAEPRVIDLPDTRIAGPSPDGRLLAAVDGSGPALRLCVYDLPSLAEHACGDLEARQIRVAVESVVWSPDSNRIAFAENAFQFLTDGDLWLMNAATGEISNLTDDGFEGNLPIFAPPDSGDPDAPIHVDVLPAWAPDGRSLAFSRSTIVGGETRGNEIAQLDLDTGAIERLVLVSFDVPGIVTFGLAWAPDGERLYYSLTHPNMDDRRNGVWVLDGADGLAHHLLPYDPEKGPPVLLRVAATGQTGLVSYPLLMAQSPFEGDHYALLDLETNQLSPVDPGAADAAGPTVVRSAAFSPDGASVLSTVTRWDDDVTDLMRREIAGGQPALVARDVAEQMMPTTIGGGLVWADDGTVFIATGNSTAVLLDLAP